MSEFRVGGRTRWALGAAGAVLLAGCASPSPTEGAPTQPNYTSPTSTSPSAAPNQGPPSTCGKPDEIISYEIDITDVKGVLLGQNGPDTSKQMWDAFQRASEKLLHDSLVPEHAHVAVGIVIGPMMVQQEVDEANRLKDSATTEFSNSRTYTFIADKPTGPIPDAPANQTLLSLTPLNDPMATCQL